MKNRKATVLSRLFSSLALLAGLLGVISFLFYWDPSRKVIKRIQASSPYKFEKIDPKYLAVNPSSLIGISSPDDLDATRQALQNVIWGYKGMPVDEMPVHVRKNFQKFPIDERCPKTTLKTNQGFLLGCSIDLFTSGDNLSGIDQLVVEVENDQKTFQQQISYFRPQNRNGRLIAYHHGYAGTHLDQWRHILRWVEQGYTVVAFDYMGYGGAGSGFAYNGGEYMRAVFKPIAVALNYAFATGNFSSANMVGLSAGGWVTTVYAALDLRIKNSYPVSGVMPVYMRERKEVAKPQLHPPLLKTVSYIDLFILGSAGSNRRQVQVFNRFDRCCYYNTRGQLYEVAVAQTVKAMGKGEFKVLLDETHARHKISRWAFEEILKDMERP